MVPIAPPAILFTMEKSARKPPKAISAGVKLPTLVRRTPGSVGRLCTCEFIMKKAFNCYKNQSFIPSSEMLGKFTPEKFQIPYYQD